MEKITKYFVKNKDVLNLTAIERRCGFKPSTFTRAIQKIADGEQRTFRQSEKLVPIYKELTRK